MHLGCIRPWGEGAEQIRQKVAMIYGSKTKVNTHRRFVMTGEVIIPLPDCHSA